MRNAVGGTLTAALVACASSGVDAPSRADVTADFARVVGTGPVSYVLADASGNAGAPFLQFDHTCAGVRYQHFIYDTITVWGDGRARRAFTLERLRDGVVDLDNHLEFTGRWAAFTRSDVFYFSDGPSISLSLDPVDGQKGIHMDMPLRVRDGAALSAEGATGGSCPGSANDARNVELWFARTTRTVGR